MSHPRASLAEAESVTPKINVSSQTVRRKFLTRSTESDRRRVANVLPVIARLTFPPVDGATRSIEPVASPMVTDRVGTPIQEAKFRSLCSSLLARCTETTTNSFIVAFSTSRAYAQSLRTLAVRAR
jgi:hypothetical protein